MGRWRPRFRSKSGCPASVPGCPARPDTARQPASPQAGRVATAVCSIEIPSRIHETRWLRPLGRPQAPAEWVESSPARCPSGCLTWTGTEPTIEERYRPRLDGAAEGLAPSDGRRRTANSDRGQCDPIRRTGSDMRARSNISAMAEPAVPRLARRRRTNRIALRRGGTCTHTAAIDRDGVVGVACRGGWLPRGRFHVCVAR
jgi:hypothetical protein